MVISKNIFICLSLILVLGHSTALAKQDCSLVFAEDIALSNQELDLDQLYMSAKLERKVGAHHEVTKILNQGFFPLIDRLTQVVQSTSTEQLKVKVQDFEANYPSYQLQSLDLQIYTHLGSLNFEQSIIGAIYHGAGTFERVYGPVQTFSPTPQGPPLKYNTKILLLKPQSGRAKDLGSLHPWFSTTISAVSSYGKKFTEDLMITTQLLSEIAIRELPEESKRLSLRGSQLVLKETARGQVSAQEKTPHDNIGLSATVEGILSFHQVLVATLSEKVPGLETGSNALRAFVFQGGYEHGLISAVVKRMPLGVVGPMANAGATFQRTFILNEKKQLVMTKEFQQYLEKYQAQAGRFPRPRRACPMSYLFQGKKEINHDFYSKSAIDQTGLQKIAEAYWKVYEVVSQSRVSVSQD